MVYQTAILFHIPLSFKLSGFVFFGSVTSYNFHWWLTPPVADEVSEKVSWNIKHKHIHLILFIFGIIGSAIFTFLMLEHWFWLLVTAFLTFLYSAPKIQLPAFMFLRKVAVGKTIFLAFAWAHITALLPMVMISSQLSDAQIWFVINRFFHIYAICILFDYRDRDDDYRAGIRSLITQTTEPGVNIIFWCSMLMVAISLGILWQFFTLPVIIALAIPTILLGILYGPSKQNFSDYLYYFVLDGLMMLSAPLLLLIKFAR